MELRSLASSLSAQPDEELAQIVVSDHDLSQRIVAMHPEMAQDAGFELFDGQWAKRYWRNIAGEITSIKSLEQLYAWAVGAEVDAAAKLVVDHYALPPGALPAAVALAIILIRAARSSKEAAGT
jgi:hypothetical protein